MSLRPARRAFGRAPRAKALFPPNWEGPTHRATCSGRIRSSAPGNHQVAVEKSVGPFADPAQASSLGTTSSEGLGDGFDPDVAVAAQRVPRKARATSPTRSDAGSR